MMILLSRFWFWMASPVDERRRARRVREILGRLTY